MATSYKYSEAVESVRGQRAKRVAMLMAEMTEYGDDPMPFEDACAELGIKQPSQLLPAMYALEFIGAVERFTYVKKSGTRAKFAYRYTDAVEIVDVADYEDDEEEEDGE